VPDIASLVATRSRVVGITTSGVPLLGIDTGLAGRVRR
jgi:hypothetical protein